MNSEIWITILNVVKKYFKDVVVIYLIKLFKEMVKPFLKALWKKVKEDIRNQLIIGLTF